jgi:ElaB/YqjD/DUF883 family membrane-anchored ribosome-binding protein
MAQQRDEDGRGEAQRGDERESKGKMSQIGEAAQEAGRQARDAASALASQATDQVQQVVQRQVRGAADVVAEVADSVRVAARRLEETMPQAAFVARTAARRIEDFSETVREQSPRELLQAGSEFARRRPVVVFGATAAMGFLMFRLLNAAPPARAEESEEDDFDEMEAGLDVDTGNEGEDSTEETRQGQPQGGGSTKSRNANQTSRKSGRNKGGQRGGAQARGS